MARNGKIARLPLTIREEVNHRLRDNEGAREILAWLNGQDAVQQILAKYFDGTPISDGNLSEWRSGGFAEWMAEQRHIDEVKVLSEFSLRAAKAAGGNLSEGLLAVNAGKIQKALEEFWDGLREIQSTEEGNDRDQAITRLLSALTSIRGMELETHKTRLKEREAERKEEELKLAKDKFQRDTAELFLKWYADRRAKEIAEGAATKDTKVAQLIQLWFGEMPEGIGPAELREAAKPQKT